MQSEITPISMIESGNFLRSSPRIRPLNSFKVEGISVWGTFWYARLTWVREGGNSISDLKSPKNARVVTDGGRFFTGELNAVIISISVFLSCYVFFCSVHTFMQVYSLHVAWQEG